MPIWQLCDNVSNINIEILETLTRIILKSSIFDIYLKRIEDYYIFIGLMLLLYN